MPYIGELGDLDARFIRLAEFLGVRCQALPLVRDGVQHAEYLERAISDQPSCLVVNPRVMKEWVGGDNLPAELVSFVLSRFPYVIVHGLRLDTFDDHVVDVLSRGRLQSVHAIDRESSVYEIAKDSRDVCGSFSGLSFGPANPVNDHVFSVNASNPAVRKLISIGGRPFMAAVRQEATEILFLASEDTAELNSEVGDAPLAEYFSRFVPHAMALRFVAGDECWRPCNAHASIIIDDPLLRKSYGFLNFESLLRLANEHNFHAAIAFIPHNFRRNSPRITRMFLENSSRLSICFHGNDHTGGEFASTDRVLLNTLLQIAHHRMDLHHTTTGLFCDRVMVFPQGNFSLEAMKALRSHNFDAAVNSVPHPHQQLVWLTIGELAQPAVLRYGGFPLFLRRSIEDSQSHDIAFNLFFGRPVLIVLHHGDFQHPESLVKVVTRINSVAPDIHWSNLASVVSNSILRRRAPDGTYHVRAYSGTVRVSNDSRSMERFSIEWSNCGQQCGPVEQVLKDELPCPGFEVDDAGIRLSVELAPGTSHKFSVVYRNVNTTVRSLGLRWNTKAFLRRRLSEIRDNYLSKNQHLLAAVKTLQRRLLK